MNAEVRWTCPARPRARRWLASLCGAIVVLNAAAAPGQQPPAFPQYQVQNPPAQRARFRSGIVTSDRATYWDDRFATLVGRILGPNQNQVVHEAAFAFMECFGGGMIDNLEGLFAKDSYTSAARHDQVAYARSENPASGVDPFVPAVRRVESLYSLPYATRLQMPATQRASAMAGYNGDIISPPNVQATWNAFPLTRFINEMPQYTADMIGDSITLHRNNPADPNTPNTRYRAILFGGSTQFDVGPALNAIQNPNPLIPPQYTAGRLAINWNTLTRIHDALVALGYAEDEMYIMYPGGEARNMAGQPTGRIFPNGPAIPAWVDAGTRARDLTAAWDTWLAPQVNASTQVFFWSSWGHGNRGPDAARQQRQAGMPVQRGQQMSFDSDAEFGAQAVALFDRGNPLSSLGTLETPYFEVAASMDVPGLSVELNGHSLSLLETLPDPFADGSEWIYKFALDQPDVDLLAASLTHTLRIDYSLALPEDASFITSMGPTLGEFANGLSLVPEPAAVVLLAAALAALAARRKSVPQRRN